MVAEWQKICDFYCDLVVNYDQPLEPMLDLARKFSQSRVGYEVYPSQSHAALGLSAWRTYEERRRAPMAYIALRADGSFDIHWQKAQGETVKTERVSEVLVPEVIDRIIQWVRPGSEA